jgi:hypothetical protein
MRDIVHQQRNPDSRFRVVVITGAPGVGKTHLAHRVVTRYALPAAAMDCDPIVYPWDNSERLYALMGAKLGACIPVYRDWGAHVMVVSGVILAGRALEPLLKTCEESDVDSVFYGLRAGPEALAARIRNDPAGQHFVEERLAERHYDAEVPDVPDIRLVDTSELTLDEVTDQVMAMERAELGPTWVAP